ncbi:nucleotidyltransferase family protein [Streptomyces sp. NPDC050164]|uniref:nucleotidyltransferase family protein n=1 Tax=Streptomyces sp. NPDC050164 TaxID=3365605 RepID=UPI003798F324
MPVPTTLPDRTFLDTTADRLAALPGVRAVTLGGSRAQGTERPDSDWDLAVYYRGEFDPDDLRAVGWEGEVCELGAWGGGVFNGGAWLTIDGRRVDVHYRDLDVVEHEVAEAGHAPKGALTQAAGAIALAATQTAHAVLAARGEWVTNEKGLVARAGLREVDAILGTLTGAPDELQQKVTDVETLLNRAVEAARS